MDRKEGSMIFSIIPYRSDCYRQMCLLRDKILRIPIGLSLTEEECERDANDILLVAKEEGRVVACCILSPIGEHMVQLRQMAVDTGLQRQGLGGSMLLFAEETARAKGFSSIMMHARKTATGFYEKYAYRIVGTAFEEVGITHYRMEKMI